ncbi:MAG TPA: formimidoylglutamate deiminase [Gemmatimonadales bacterium]|nr:formimidoylglutamate deiminase [Gemmatimonadales bacterium]
MTRQILQADSTWIDGEFVSGHAIDIGDDGRIAAVTAAGREARAPARRLSGIALLPGFVNAHSHAFQRGLRGSGERFASGAGSFWSWREAMYALVASLDRAELGRLCRQSFGEMRDAGITSVGEFHYLHHDQGRDYGFDDVVLEAASEIGIRLVLLQTYYAAGGIGRFLEAGQQRFATLDLRDYWRQVDRIAGRLDPATQSLGVVAHSVRAVSLPEIKALHAEALRRDLPFHMHVEEQRREIDDSLEAYRRTPMRLLCDELAPGAFTAVHCTHTSTDDMAAFLSRGGRVCVCPLTEANLGDGIPDLSAVHAAGGRLALGTDSNARISAIEEMRWLEYGQRLRGERRGALADRRGQVAATTLEAATTGGAAALGIRAGRIAPGEWADFAAVDLAAPALAGVPASGLLDAIVFGAGNGVIAGTYVGGNWRPAD